jgi:Bacterial archaeo-eukaryotic release factor family 10
MLTAETVDRIVQFSGRDLPVTSVYARVDADPGRREDLQARMSSMLDQIRPLAKNGSLGHEARLSVRADIARIKTALAEERWKPGAIAIFACSGRDLYEEVALPQAVRDRVLVDAAPYVRPMLTVLDEVHRACVVLVDKDSACVWEVYQDEIRELENIRGQALRRSGYTDRLDEYRGRNKADELAKRHYRNVAQMLEDLFRPGEFDLLIIGGHDYEVPAFTEFLSPGLRSVVAGTFSVDPGAARLAAIRAHADEILARYDRDAGQRLVADLEDRVVAGGLAAAGLGTCLWAGSVAAVQTLAILDGAQEPGVVCDHSRWLGLAGDTCPLCGRPTRRTPDVIAELAEVVAAEGGVIRHVASSDWLADYEVAAALRFQPPPSPEPPPAGPAAAGPAAAGPAGSPSA